MQLPDLVAEVIKVEDPSVRGDVSQYMPPFQDGTDSTGPCAAEGGHDYTLRGLVP
jgi:hypothetical protein